MRILFMFALPILTVVEPVTVPLYKSNPNLLMALFASIFLGVLAGSALVLASSWLVSLGVKNKYLDYIVK